MKCKYSNDECMCNNCYDCPCERGIQQCEVCKGESPMDGCPFWINDYSEDEEQ